MPAKRFPLHPDNLIKEYRAGASIKQLARDHGVTFDMVKKTLIGANVSIRGRMEQMRLNRNAIAPDIIAAYKSGKTIKEIGAMFGMTDSNVSHIMKANDVQARSLAIDLPIDEIQALHDSGRTVAEIARAFGVTNKVITRIMGQNGITPRLLGVDMTAYRAKIAGFDLNTAASMFNDGIGVRGIANHFGIPTTTVISIFKSNGIATRGRSEQQFARMSRLDLAGRKALVKAANAAATGRTVSAKTLAQSAQTSQIRQSRLTSPAESLLASMLLDRGIVTEPQTAVGPYNCDLTTYGVAVEVWGGYWHFYGDHAARNEKRFRYILDAGWNVIILGVTDRHPITSAVADYVASEIKLLRRNPPSVREYRMIWGAGEFASGGSSNDENITLVRPFVRSSNRRLA